MQTQIAYNLGTVIGDFNDRLANAFDNNTNQNLENSATKTGSPTVAYAGKDWGEGVTKIITGFKAYGSNDAGFAQGADPDISISLIGSSANNPSAGTNLGSATPVTDAAGLLISKMTGLITTTAYRYHWLKIEKAAGTYILCAEAQFFEGSDFKPQILIF